MSGGVKDVELLLNKKKERIIISPCTQPNSELRFTDSGFMKANSTSKRGDQVYIIKVKIPDYRTLGTADKEKLIEILNRL